ncbi:MAG: complex I subunit 5 family protein [Desulfurococcaceae archaeon]
MQVGWWSNIALATLMILAGNVILHKSALFGNVFKIIGYIYILLFTKGVDVFSNTLIAASSITGVSLTFYTYAYSKSKYSSISLPPLIDLFLISMILVFRSGTLIEFITFWLLTELIAFFLIAYDYMVSEDVNSMRASVKYLVFSMIPTDLALFIILALAGFEDAFTKHILDLSINISNPLVLVVIILGFFAKAAVIPLHFWLPDAHSVAPSPASVLLSGLMVKMGIYALYLLSSQIVDVVVSFTMMTFLGGLTAVYGAAQASLQRDLKRLLAYSTTSETGVLSLIAGLYVLSRDESFITAIILYSLAHAVYKSFMFMDSGYIEVTIHTRNINELGFVSKLSPMQTTNTLMSIISYLGMPPSIGFLAKLYVFTTISKHLGGSVVYFLALLVLVLKVVVSVLYNAIYLKAHLGKQLSTKMFTGCSRRDEVALKTSCFTSSLYSYVIIIYALSVLQGRIIVQPGLVELLYATIAILLLVSLTLYPLIYIVLKRGTNGGVLT